MVEYGDLRETEFAQHVKHLLPGLSVRPAGCLNACEPSASVEGVYTV